MNSLPLALHTAAQVRDLDRHAIEVMGIASYMLMTRAGAAALAALRRGWPTATRVVVVCGPGNNGGDGYVLARFARADGFDVVVIAVAAPADLQGDARRAHDDFIAAGGAVHAWSDQSLDSAEVIVDAIFGTGLSRAVDARVAACIRAINASAAEVFALDVPSGLHADTGAVLGVAIDAKCTLSFIGLKLGFYLGEGPDHTGTVMFDALGLSADALGAVTPAAWRIADDVVAAALPRRQRTTHKGAHGRVLVIAGGYGMAGAARMAAEAALRVGAGLVTVATRPENCAAIVSARPELMCHAIERAQELEPLLARADVLAVGPGLGQDSWAESLLEAAIGSGKPSVIDADGLNMLARRPRRDSRWVLTPHPGEAGRLLGVATAGIQKDRLAAARAIAENYGGVVVLKGAGTIVAHGVDPPHLCDRGNPGMATPGMGDVLTGVIAGIAAQCPDLVCAAKAGVLVHALAGDLAARSGERGAIATDLFHHLQSCIN